MPDVILLDPNPGVRNSRPQLGTLHLAAMLLQSGISVELIDFSVRDNGVKLLEKFLESDVVCVGISTMIGPMLGHSLELAQIVRKQRPDVPIVWGGIHPTTAPGSTLKHQLVDAICIGEGETTFVQMVGAYRNGRKLHDIPGIGFKEHGNIHFTPPRKAYFDLDMLPPLPYHLIDLSLYQIPSKARDEFFRLKGKQVLSIETSRGCPFHCTYCVHSARPEKFRTMSPGKVLQSIEDIVNQGVNSITINDDNFFVNRKRATEILKAITRKKYGIDLFVAVRSDYLSSIDNSDFELMKAAGIALLGIGVESGSDRMLEKIKKNETIEKTFAANRQLAKFAINAIFHFIYGFPGETKGDFGLTFKAMHQILQENPSYARVNLNRLIPNPGSQSFQECVAEGWTPPDTIEQWANVMRRIWRRTPVYMDPELARWVEPLKSIKFPTNILPDIEQIEFAYKYRLLTIPFRYLRKIPKYIIRKLRHLIKK